MPTIDSKEIVDNIISNNGIYINSYGEKDHPVIQITQYTNQWGGISYHLAYSHSNLNSLYMSPFCRELKILWPLTPEEKRVRRNILENNNEI